MLSLFLFTTVLQNVHWQRTGDCAKAKPWNIKLKPITLISSKRTNGNGM